MCKTKAKNRDRNIKILTLYVLKGNYLRNEIDTKRESNTHLSVGDNHNDVDIDIVIFVVVVSIPMSVESHRTPLYRPHRRIPIAYTLDGARLPRAMMSRLAPWMTVGSRPIVSCPTLLSGRFHLILLVAAFPRCSKSPPCVERTRVHCP